MGNERAGRDALSDKHVHHSSSLRGHLIGRDIVTDVTRPVPCKDMSCQDNPHATHKSHAHPIASDIQRKLLAHTVFSSSSRPSCGVREKNREKERERERERERD